MDTLKLIILLEAIHKVQGKVNFPLVDGWMSLEDEIDDLISEGYLDQTGQITDAGKKTLLMFRAEKKDILDGVEVYKEVNVRGRTTDGRIPLLAYKTRNNPTEKSQPYLETLAYMILWDTYFELLKSLAQGGHVEWQKHLFTSLEGNMRKLAQRDSWKLMGINRSDALSNCERLLNSQPLTQIQKR